MTLCEQGFQIPGGIQVSLLALCSRRLKMGRHCVSSRPNSPKDFVLCLNFNPTGTKGVYVSHDAEGKSLVGLPGKPGGSFTGGDWMIRAVTDKLK